MQAEHTHERRHTPTPQQEATGRSRNPSPSTHTYTAHPSQEWRGTSEARTCTPQHPSQEWRRAAEARAQAHPPTPRSPARSGGAPAERAHEHTRIPTPQLGMVGRNQIPSPSTRTNAAHPSQEWRGTSGASTQTYTPNTPARRGGAQPKLEPKHTHPHRNPKPGVAGHKRSAHTSAHTPQHPGKGGRGAAETRAQPRTPTQHTRSRSGGVQPERAYAHPNTQARSCGAQPKPEAERTHPHRIPQPGVAGHQRSAHTNTHTPQHPGQEWRGAAETRAQAHTPTPHTPARSGGVQAERVHKDAHLNSPARRGGAQPKPDPKQTHPHHTPQPGVAGYRRSTHTSTHTHPDTPAKSGGAELKAEPKHTPKSHTPARRGGVQAERAQPHPNTPAKNGGAQPKPELKHPHQRRTPQPGVAGYKRSSIDAPCLEKCVPLPSRTAPCSAFSFLATEPQLSIARPPKGYETN